MQDFSFIKNAPIQVNYAGLSGTTMSMQNQGWELAIDGDRNVSTYESSYNIRIAGRHKGMGLRILSYPMSIEADLIRRPEPFRSLCFNIYVAAENLNFSVVDYSCAPKFRAVDFSRPEFSTPTNLTLNKHFSLDECAFFKPFDNEETTIYLPEKEIWTAEKHLIAIRDLQKDKQKELRSKYGNLDIGTQNHSSKSSHNEIKFQLVGV